MATEPVITAGQLHLLAYLYFTGDERIFLNTIIIHRDLAFFAFAGLITGYHEVERTVKSVPTPLLTDKGRAHVDYLLSCQFPVERVVWARPDASKEGGA